MNALYVLSLVVAVANAQYYNGFLPYSHNLLHTTAFSSPVASPLQYTLAAPHPFRYNVAAAAPASVKYSGAAAPAPLTFAAPAPVAYTTAAVAPGFVVPTTRTSQYHAQDEFGQYSFGYSGGPSSRNEVRDAFGVVRGSYNYVDANGQIQTQSYIADSNGFRVAATNLPVAPKAGDAPTLVGPEPVMDTDEVKAAIAAHQLAWDEAAAAAAAAPDSRRKRSVGSVAIHAPVSPLRFAYGFNTVHPSTLNTGLPYNYGVHPYTTGAYAYSHNAYAHNAYAHNAYAHNAYPYNFAHTW